MSNDRPHSLLNHTSFDNTVNFVELSILYLDPVGVLDQSPRKKLLKEGTSSNERGSAVGLQNETNLPKGILQGSSVNP